ncbi:hypothetical protein ALI22I_28475 [Saccharothrix sp. ALI-22-I]|uniref:recombinase family protein n=1 Tax=Saccharothrix sp. ALI-22-I TaxID=1933778 RepID=UPI00097BB868|nr:recombinase family protein [Saccharothrix sp. ALI-22-I]ONI85699.1 hypothetical protein ALI22I_28475 [Saccharothrix sp. ALI-22-I]
MTGRSHAGSYGRQSAGNASPVVDQHRVNEAACGEHGWETVERYSDYVSASRFGKKKRSDWGKLVADVKAGRLDVVVMWDLSRGDRTVSSWAEFVDLCRERGVLIHATAHSRTYDARVPRDWRTLMDDGVEAGFDSEQKSLVVRRGIAGAALAGKSHGRPGYGYTRRYDQTDRRLYVDVPDERADIAREIITRCAAEEPLKHIVEDLNSRFLGPKGKPWSSVAVKTIATHPRYIGMRRHNGELFPANWKPIIDEATFHRAVAVLTAPDRKRSAPASMKHFLSYIASAPCGLPLNVAPEGKQRPARYRCFHDTCVSVRVDDLDDIVTDVILKRLSRPDARGLFVPPDGEASEAQAEVSRLQARLDEARASFASPNGISAVALAALEHAVQPQLEAAQRRVAELTTCAAGLELLGDGRFTVDVGAPRWEALSLAGRRSIAKTLFERIELGPSDRRLTRWDSREDRLLAAVERTTFDWRVAEVR